MDKLLYEIQDQLTEPLMKEIERLYLEHLESEQIPKGQLGTPASILKKTVEKDMRKFKDLVLGREELSLMETGRTTFHLGGRAG